MYTDGCRLDGEGGSHARTKFPRALSRACAREEVISGTAIFPVIARCGSGQGAF